MKYEFELFDLVCWKLTAPPKKRGGGIIYLASRFILSSLVNTVYRLLMLKVMNQVWYIIIFLHMLSAKYLTACSSLCSEGYLSTQKTWLRGQMGEKNKLLCLGVLSEVKNFMERRQRQRHHGGGGNCLTHSPCWAPTAPRKYLHTKQE